MEKQIGYFGLKTKIKEHIRTVFFQKEKQELQHTAWWKFDVALIFGSGAVQNCSYKCGQQKRRMLKN